MSKHTPGPWEAQKREGMAGKYRPWHIAASFYSKPGITDGRDSIAEIETSGGPEQREANARLIAAAPELLEALCMITDQLERVGDDRKDAPFIEAARAAIAKAEGRP